MILLNKHALKILEANMNVHTFILSSLKKEAQAYFSNEM